MLEVRMLAVVYHTVKKKYPFHLRSIYVSFFFNRIQYSYVLTPVACN